MSDYGPYLIIQDLPPLRLPMQQNPDVGMLFHAEPKDQYTTFATVEEAEACIGRDAAERGHRADLDMHLKVLAVEDWEADQADKRQPPSKRRKAKVADES